MIPVRLEIEGLYSYRQKQTVEFEQLTAAGLFGIFGAVGSGKSSILEAILLALYGSTERLAATGERSSMVNLQSDQLLIIFTFRAGKSNSQTYLARYSAKRNKKDPEKIDTGEHVFYAWENENWQATAQKAEEILGMGKDHFKQTVIIPQGKFREFIDQKPLERAEMMQQLFGLERFDLSSKNGILLKAAREEKIRLETQLAGLDEVSEEVLEEKNKTQAELKTQSETADRNLKTAEIELRALETRRKSFLLLKDLSETLDQLQSRKPEIDQQRQLHREFITAKTHLRPVWDRLNDAKSDLEKYRVSVRDCERFKETYEKEIGELEKEERDLITKNEQRPEREAKIRDLKKVIEVKALEEKIDESERALETLRPEIDSKKAAQKQLEAEIQTLEDQLDFLPAIDANLLSELKTSAAQLQTLQERSRELQGMLDQSGQAEAAQRQTLEAIKDQIPNREESLDIWANSEKRVLEDLELNREKLLRKQGLAAHTHLLAEGEPCPLCGSAEHPNPLTAEAESTVLQEKEKQIQEARAKLDRISSLIQSQKIEESRLETLLQNKLEKTSELQKLQQQRIELGEKLTQLGIKDKSELATKIKGLIQSGSQRDGLTNAIQAKRKIWQAERESLEKSEKSLQQAQLTHQSLLASTQSKRDEIKDPTFCKAFFPKNNDTIQAAIQSVERDIETAIESLRGKQKHLLEKRAEQSKNLANIDQYRRLASESEIKVAEFASQFEELKQQHHFPDEPVLIRLFHHSLDAEKVDLEIRQFDQKLATTQSRISELKSEEGVSNFSETAFLEAQSQTLLLKSQATQLQNELILLKQEIKTLTENLDKKRELSKTFSLVENRESNLKELERLFQGKGFVKFVSSIYLRELCNTANQRFMKLTKNSLSLEIDDSNTFWVVDYLNGGKKRLLKTLSGGQTFQAALCLALALAEKVKALNQADQSFFFLDEGFGALDRNALRVVFETLKALRHENRIVGIISHVEELQQEIGVFAQVELDPDLGSQISYSF
jgi:exonuclease SbcC